MFCNSLFRKSLRIQPFLFQSMRLRNTQLFMKRFSVINLNDPNKPRQSLIKRLNDEASGDEDNADPLSVYLKIKNQLKEQQVNNKNEHSNSKFNFKTSQNNTVLAEDEEDKLSDFEESQNKDDTSDDLENSSDFSSSDIEESREHMLEDDYENDEHFHHSTNYEDQLKNYDKLTEEQKAKIDELMQLETEVSKILKDDNNEFYTKLSCEGCGIKLQTRDQNIIGFIAKNKLEGLLRDNLERAKHRNIHDKDRINKNDIYYELNKTFRGRIPSDIRESLELELERQDPNINESKAVTDYFQGEEIEEGKDKYVMQNMDVLDHLHQIGVPTVSEAKRKFKKLLRRPIICMRCHKLKFQKQLIEQQKYQKDVKVLADYVKDFDREGIIKYITNRIHFRDIIIKVVDITDFEGTIIPEIFEIARINKCMLVLVVNKIDCLPKHVSTERTQKWIQKQINPYKKDLRITVCQVSSKNGSGFDKIVTIMNKLKKVYVTDKIHNMKPKIFVLGCTNSGKSSFLNQLIYNTTLNKDKREKGKRGVALYDRESEDHEKTLFKENRLLQEMLTASPLPGTTMDFIEVKDVKFGLKIFDTPGVPNKTQVSSHVDNYEDTVQTLCIKKINSISLNIKSGYSIWIGALARLDFLNGERKDFTFFVSPHVTIHKTPLEKAQLIYENHAGELLRPTYNIKPNEVQFEKHNISLKCDSWEKANYDISISGLGWVSVQGSGIAQFMLHIPKEIGYHIRDPLMPFEVHEKGLQRYKGNTINANSKKNIRGKEKFKLRKEMAIEKSSPNSLL